MKLRILLPLLLCLAWNNIPALDAFGVGSHWNEAKYWPLLKDAGVQWVRIDLSWYHFENVPGNFGNQSVDQALHMADSLGLKVVAILGYTPNWAACGGGTNNKFGPAEAYYPQWFAYLDSTVSEYRNLVDAWEVWNEPDQRYFYQAGPGCHSTIAKDDYYWLEAKSLEHLRAKFGAQLQITSSGFALGGNNDPTLFPDLLSSHPEIWKQWNVLSVHGYGYPTQKNLLSRIAIANDFHKTHPGVPVWLTEHGVTGMIKNNVSVADAGAFMVRNYATALSNGIEKVFWFRLIPGKDYATLLDKSGTPTEFLWIYKRLIQHWGAATHVEPWTEQNAQGAVATLPNGNKAYILWADQSTPLKLTGVISVRDIFGNALATDSITLNPSPLFITTHG